MNKTIFEDQFFKNFGYCELKKDMVLYDINTEIDYIYFIIEGEVELFINSSIRSLTNKLHELCKVAKFSNLHPLEYKFKKQSTLKNIKQELSIVKKMKVRYPSKLKR